MATESSEQPCAAPITAVPAAGQLIEYEGKTYETIREGQAYILIPPNTQKQVNPQGNANTANEPVKAQSVFYNPIQQFNRDVSVLAIKAFGEDWAERKRHRKGKPRNKNKRKRLGENGTGGVKLRKTEDGGVVSAEIDPGEEIIDEAAKETAPTSAGATEPVSTSSIEAQVSTGENQHSEQPAKPSGPKLRILDALSATGLRALRYAKEIPHVSAIVANDMNPNAIQSMHMNVQHNDLKSLITPNLGDAIGHMYSVAYPPTTSHGPRHNNQKYDVIDLDPYGTAAPFVDAALQSLNDGGLLCVTCTDSGVFASIGYSEKTYALYGGMPVKGSYMHEAGLRLIINSIASTAAKYGIAIEPLLSLKIDFYARVFIRVRHSPAEVKFLAGKVMLVYSCDTGCGAWTTNMLGRNTKQIGKNDTVWFKHSIAQAPTADRLCEQCGSKTHLAGPMWGGPLHNAAFIEKILDDLEDADSNVYETKNRVEGMLTTALEELIVNEEVTKYTKDRKEGEEVIPKIPVETTDKHPFFFNISALAKVIHCVAPPDAAIKGALRHAGYVATRTHCEGGNIKTNAPWSVIWEIMREWVRQRHPIKEGALKETTAGWRIMQAARAVENEAEKEGQLSEDGAKNTREDETAAPKPADGKIKVKFDEVLGRDKLTKKLVRYQQNPRENWGPMTKAKGGA